MPVAINTAPEMRPALCSSLCQFSRTIPLYAMRIHNSMPASVITAYIAATAAIIHQPFVPANKK